MLLNFGHAIVVVAVVDDDVVDVSFLMVNEVAMGLVRMKKQQNLASNFLDVMVISYSQHYCYLHCFQLQGSGASGLERLHL